MKKTIKKVLGAALSLLLLVSPASALAANITVPSAPGNGYALVSTTTGAYVATTTSPLHVGSVFASSTTQTSTISGPLALPSVTSKGLYTDSSGVVTGTSTWATNFGGTGQDTHTWTGLTLTTAGAWSQYAGSSPCSSGTQAALSFSASGVISCTNVATFAWPFTSTTNFGALANSTSTPAWFRGGLMASTTSYLTSTFQASSTAPQLFLDDLGSAFVSLRNIGGNLFISTSTQAAPNATSTKPTLSLTVGGQLSTGEDVPATSTSMVVDWAATKNQVDLQIGTAAMTIGFNNASTSGMTKRILVCDSGSAASTVTWSVGSLLWSAGTAPTQTTTANKCDIYSFIVTQATSSTATTKILGAATQNF